MSKELIGRIKSLPYDIQELILHKHAKRYNESSSFMVEMFIQSRSVMNWHINGKECEDGQDEHYYDSIPIMQVIYNSGTQKWYSPEYITHPFIYRTNHLTPFSISYAPKQIGAKELSSRKIKHLVTSIMRSKTYKDIIDILEMYKNDTNPAKQKMLRDKNNGALWQCSYDIYIRIQEIYKTMPTERSERWWMYVSTDFSKTSNSSSTFPFYMIYKHVFAVKDDKDAMYKWGLVRSLLERDGCVDNIKKL